MSVRARVLQYSQKQIVQGLVELKINLNYKRRDDWFSSSATYLTNNNISPRPYITLLRCVTPYTLYIHNRSMEYGLCWSCSCWDCFPDSGLHVFSTLLLYMHTKPASAPVNSRRITRSRRFSRFRIRGKCGPTVIASAICKTCHPGLDVLYIVS